MSARISQQQLESYLWGAATLLRGTIDAGDYKQFIFPLLFYKRLCDVFDEETQAALQESGGDAGYAAGREQHRFQIPSEAHWREIRQAAKNVGRALQGAMRAIETANPEKLYGIFGDAQWTNRDRLPDAMLRDLVEHFSTLDLTLTNLPEDELGQGYEYLIKKFADDSGHTAAEFYTNRTVVHLMAEMLEPQPGESIYDPTCGSGGMLLSSITHLRRQRKEWRNVRLYGQERNLMTSSIARMNCFLHGIEDFRIERGDTLSEPKFVEGDRLMRFDVILANPPYSIKQWDRDAFASDPWGRNLYGTPPQGRADYAFWQHILCSLSPKKGRCAILFPHGVLFRQEEADMRRKLIEADLIECVIGLGPSLFYNSAMEACVVICRASKPKDRHGRILLINAVNEVTRERAQSFLTREHIERIVAVYRDFGDATEISRVVALEEALANNGNLNVALYVESSAKPLADSDAKARGVTTALDACLASVQATRQVFESISPQIATRPVALSRQLHRLGLLQRTGWRRVKFSEVAVRTAGKFHFDGLSVHRWVAAEHINEADLHVRRWSDTQDPLFPPTFRYTFKAGDVLLHSRNPKKVAIPTFDGITGEKLFVLRPRDIQELRPDFLALVLMSTQFRDWANRWLSGSVNKFLNWSALERFEFELPPLEQQRRISDLLTCLDKSQEALRIHIDSCERAVQAALDEVFSADGTIAKTSMKRLDEITSKIVDGIHHTPTYTSEGVPFIVIENLNRGPDIDFANTRFVSLTDHQEFTKRANPELGDVLVSKDGTLGVVRVVNTDWPFSIFVSVALLKPKRNILNGQFLALYLRSRLFWTHVRRTMSGSALKHIHLQDFRSAPCPLFPMEAQLAHVQKVAALEGVARKTVQRLASLRELSRSLIEAFT